MKTLTIISTLLLFNCGIIQGQTFDEWFRQKKTQKKYLVEQIASLKIFLGNLKKGVDIAYKGWNTISNIKDGNFMLHRDFLSSLKQVNPAIRNSAKVADIITLQFYLLRDLRNLSNYCQYNSNFTPEEARYVALVYTNMTRLCDASLSELLMIIRSDETEMKDDERIKRIDKIYDDTYDKHSFVQVFSNGTRILSSERESEKRDSEVLKRNHEVI